jgi:hypothetical protein
MESSCRRLSSPVRLVAACLLVGGCALLCGCQTAAPIHVWAPPRIDSAVGKRIAIAPLTGDPQIAGPLRAAMLRSQPRDAGREVVAIDATRLPDDQKIRLVSATEGEPSDITIVSLARRAGIDYVLMGDVLQSPHSRRVDRYGVPNDLAQDIPMANGRSANPLNPSDLGSDAASVADPPLGIGQDELLRVSWNLIDVRRGTPLSGQPVVTRRDPSRPISMAIDEAAEAAWELVIPHVVRDQAELAAPRMASGSGGIRRGNEAAASGDWNRAEQLWSDVLRKHPKSHAAMHNLAVAAVARQDYSEARRQIAAALAAKSSPLYQTTAVWIERRQRDYHIAFGLPDPPEGWAATRR